MSVLSRNSSAMAIIVRYILAQLIVQKLASSTLEIVVPVSFLASRVSAAATAVICLCWTTVIEAVVHLPAVCQIADMDFERLLTLPCACPTLDLIKYCYSQSAKGLSLLRFFPTTKSHDPEDFYRLRQVRVRWQDEIARHCERRWWPQWCPHNQRTRQTQSFLPSFAVFLGFHIGFISNTTSITNSTTTGSSVKGRRFAFYRKYQKE